MSSSSSAAPPPVERPSAVFSIGINGLTSVVLSQPGGYSAEVLLYGGQVKSWKNKRGDELLFISKKAVFEPYNPIRGGIPICFPTFINNGGTEQLGLARLRFWEVDTSIDLTTSSDKASIDLILRPTHDDLLNCPNQFEFRLRVILEPNGDLKMNSHISNLNSDGKPFTFLFSYHTYFYVSDIRGKLSDLREVKRTDQFVHRRFAEEVEQRLQEYVSRIQYLEEHGIEVKISEDRQREGISELLKNKRTYSHDLSTCPFVVMSHGCLSGSKPAKFNNEDTSEMNGYIPQDMDTDVSRSWGGVGSNNGYYDYSGGGNNDDGNDDTLGEDYEVDDDGEGSDDDSGEGSDDDSGEGSDDDSGEGSDDDSGEDSDDDSGEGSDDDSGEDSDDDSGEDSDDDSGEDSDDDNGEDSDDDDGEGSDDDDGEDSDDDDGGESDHEFDNALYRPYWFNDDFFWQANQGGHLTEDDCIDRHRIYLEYERDYSYDYEDDHGVHRYVCYDPPEGARPEDIDFISHHEEKLRQGLTNNQIACPPYWPNAKSGPDGEPIRDWDVDSHIPWHVQLEEKERARRAK